MKRNYTRRRIIATFLLTVFLQSFIPYQLLASNNGPNAPEAAAFEPVDATDMVNLVTGDLSYVLPLLNIPSPEGGYPLALSYHGGIAMEQEASWVGLGWNLNPGAINRNVNGYPDDWKSAEVIEFFYDKGWTEDYYSLGIGGTIYGASVGLAASWGSNQSLGGSVSFGYGGINATISDKGISSVGIKYGGIDGGLSASFNSNGSLNIGYFAQGLGLDLGLSSNSGLSVGISNKLASSGVTFNSQGLSNLSLGSGAGISFSASNTTVNDYDRQFSSIGFTLPIYLFYVSYSHTKVKYSLFKEAHLRPSGTLYPYQSNYRKSNSNLLLDNSFMDVSTTIAYQKDQDPEILIDEEEKRSTNNIVLPNHDSYVVNSQGISGKIAASSYSELVLSGRGDSQENPEETYFAYLTLPNHPSDLDEYDLGNKTHFYFKNSYNSFLRINRGNISDPGIASVSEENALLFETSDDASFSNSVTPDGEAIFAGNRRRMGNYIETFTNEQIREGTVSNFIEAKGLDRNQNDIMKNEGIGGFRITTLDGKTYHYSLPVYNYEVFYKNFPDEEDEDKNFLEIQKTEPYATHWLLTAITGPDYLDTNSNYTVDIEDYGYWIEFDYGKWSDGYVWRGPIDGGYETNKGNEEDTYSYVWGRKQIYYLDQVKTRTHTATFVKSLREDNQGSNLEKYKSLIDYGNESFDPINHAEFYTNDARKFISLAHKGLPGSSFQTYVDGCYYNVNTGYSSQEASFEYLDIPNNKTLKLDRIILSKNEDIGEISKSSSNNIPMSQAKLSKGSGHKFVQSQTVYTLAPGELGECDESWGVVSDFADFIPFGQDPEPVLHVYEQQIADNIIDEEDIESLALEQSAIQVIAFNYDYELVKNSPNSEAETGGRLTLKKVNFKGKGGVQVTPPYSFDYYWPNVSYNTEARDDWGYYETNPEAWSLKEITTPIGSKIKIDLESDSYWTEAAFREPIVFDDIYSISKNGSITTINFNSIENIYDHFEVGGYAKINYKEHEGYDFQAGNFENYNTTDQKLWVEVVSLTDNSIDFQIDDPVVLSHISCSGNTTSPICIDNVKVQGELKDLSTELNPNGRLGGGIRVSQIEVMGENNFTLNTEYRYSNPLTDRTTGVTSYSPSNEPKEIPYIENLPHPSVLYGFVTMEVKDNLGNKLNETVYEFETIEPFELTNDYLFNLGETFKVEENQDESFLNGDVIANKYTVYNKASSIGRLKAVHTYNSFDQLISRKENTYKEDLDNDGEIGVTQESYRTVKRVIADEDTTFMVSSSSEVNYPSVLESTSKLSNGYRSQTFYDSHDFLTGQVLETRTYDSKGNTWKNQVVPAYHISVYEGSGVGFGMGSKVDNPTNRNMLTQEAATYTYLMDEATGEWEPVGVGITTWNNEWTYREADGSDFTPTEDVQKVWRKHATYGWQGDGTVNEDGTLANFTDDFDWTLGATQTSNWKRMGLTTRYDHYSMPLEVEDINGNKASTKMGYKNTKVIATANAGYDENFYTGAEDLYDGNRFSGDVLLAPGASVTSDHSHTGTYAIEATGTDALTVTPGEAGTYRVSVWAKEAGYEDVRVGTSSGDQNFNEGEVVRAGGWVMLHFTFDANAGETVTLKSIGSKVYLDDFRMHPVASSMTSYVYNEWDELTYILGANNLATMYEYDAAGRLSKVYSEVVDYAGPGTGGFKLSSEHSMKYKLMGELDTNGNGVIDPFELYDPLGATFNPENGYSNPGTMQVIPSGGSGQYQYQFGSGEITVLNQINSINYGAVTGNNTYYVSNAPCTGGSYGYHARVLKIKVIDQETGQSEEYLKYYNKSNCGENPGGSPGGPIEEPQENQQ